MLGLAAASRLAGRGLTGERFHGRTLHDAIAASCKITIHRRLNTGEHAHLCRRRYSRPRRPHDGSHCAYRGRYRRRPIEYAVEVYLGDYIDRGPDSRTVIDALAMRMVENGAVCLRGNHEALLEQFLRDHSAFEHWHQLGALQTLASYVFNHVTGTYGRSAPPISRRVSASPPTVPAMPAQQLLLRRLSVRACRHPSRHSDRAAGRQRSALDPSRIPRTGSDHGKFIVHGHTPVPHPDIRHNRINIDTGAWKTGASPVPHSKARRS